MKRLTRFTQFFRLTQNVVNPRNQANPKNRRNLKELGFMGEREAKTYLEAKGYKVLHENYTTSLGEIDLIAREGETLVFVEVKTRFSLEYGSPEASVTHGKRRQIIKAAELYLLKARLKDVACRFDVVAVTFPREGEAPLIELIRNAFP